MTRSQIDLASLFAVAQKTLAANQQEINALDGYNGNHGDNMVQNVQMIVDALRQRQDQPPAAALEHASHRLQAEGRGGTSQYYAQGLHQAAQQLQGQSGMTADGALTMLQSLLSAIPSETRAQQPQAGGSVLDLFLGMSEAQPPAEEPKGSPMGGLLKSLLPAALTYFRAKQSGADSTAAVGQALMGILTGSQHVNPLQSGDPRAAAGGLLAQSVLEALRSGR